jgi:ribosomal protein S18 acetylase RimI-like enzyme
MAATRQQDTFPVSIRHPNFRDHGRVLAVIGQWWRDLPPEEASRVSNILHPLFFQHFSGTSYVADNNAELAGFLIGFMSPSQPGEAYIHTIGVAPEMRRQGLARELYGRFFQAARDDRRDIVTYIVPPGNSKAIAFHKSLGFRPLSGNGFWDGIPVWRDYAGPGADRIVLRKRLSLD